MLRFKASPGWNAIPLATTRAVLLGDVVTMNNAREVILHGRLCLEGKNIVAVLRPGDPLPTGFCDVQQINVGGTIYPGLFDLHNHLPYNMIPLWQVGGTFTNRKQWQALPDYYPAVRAPFGLLNNHQDLDYRRAIIRFTECRNLLGGVTTGHGMGLTKQVTYAGLMRNIEEPSDGGLPKVKSRTADMRLKDIADMVEWTSQGRPYIYHLAEGVDQAARDCLFDLQQVAGALNRKLVCIHAVGLQAEDFALMTNTAGIVWSPTSNLLLYGQTCRIADAKRFGVPIAIGADWSPSGCKNLLGELKVARATSTHFGGVLSDKELVEAVTCVPAKMIGWDAQLGSIEPGKRADLLVLAGSGQDPYTQLIEARESNVRALLIDGRLRLGQSDLTFGEPMSSEKLSVGGKTYVFDLAEPDGDGIGGMTLVDALAKIDDGLRRLPELEAEQKTLLRSGILQSTGWQLEDEMHDVNIETLLLEGSQHPAIAMRLAPLTAVDDPDFAKQMHASVNLPDYVKEVFR